MDIDKIDKYLNEEMDLDDAFTQMRKQKKPVFASKVKKPGQIITKAADKILSGWADDNLNFVYAHGTEAEKKKMMKLVENINESFNELLRNFYAIERFMKNFKW